MPMTVITLKRVPPSLRGDLTRWMQEIDTGVYVGNFNSRIREELWERVIQTVGDGEATITYAKNNEIGYEFHSNNRNREVVDFDGVPLVRLLSTQESSTNSSLQKGFSNAAKYKKIRQVTSAKKTTNLVKDYVVIDIETDGLDYKKNSIIEVGAIKSVEDKVLTFESLVEYNDNLPENISDLTGITIETLKKEGKPLKSVLLQLVDFIGELDVVGYSVNFDYQFINKNLKDLNLPELMNTKHDLRNFVKKEKMFLKDYRLETVLHAYEINYEVEHRALADAKLIYELSRKVNKFLDFIE